MPILVYTLGVALAICGPLFFAVILMLQIPAPEIKKPAPPIIERTKETSTVSPKKPPIWIAPTPEYKYPSVPQTATESMAYEPAQKKTGTNRPKKSSGRPSPDIEQTDGSQSVYVTPPLTRD